MKRPVDPGQVGGRAKAPASKSAMQRALACAAMAEGRSVITNPSLCDDSLAAIEVVNALGASAERLDDRVGVRGGLTRRGDAITLSCGESGLCIRMFSAIASLLDVDVELRAKGSLSSRSVGMVCDALSKAGVRCSTRDGHPPVRVHGPLRPGRYEIDGAESSQFVTGLLLALPMTGGDSTLRVRKLASAGYTDLTIDVMKAFGAEIRRAPGDRGRDETVFEISGDTPYVATEYEIEGDWSGAAFLLVAGAIAGSESTGIEVTGLAPGSPQPDRAILEALRLSGARVESAELGYRVLPAALRAFSFDAGGCPDLFPPLVALASRCEGNSVIRGASRLRGKESDRASALAEEFAKLGLTIEIGGDEMTVHGLGTVRRLGSGETSARGDHRVAMALAVAALAGSGPVVINGAECVAKSFPDFFATLDSLRN